MSELMVSKDCVNITNKLNACTFDIEFTIRGNFNPQKLQIIHCIHYGGLRFAIERDIKCLEFISYDGDIIQTHLTNGKPLCFPYEGYISYQKIIDKLPPYNQVPEGQSDIISDTT